jgi:hypothetical protein
MAKKVKESCEEDFHSLNKESFGLDKVFDNTGIPTEDEHLQ